MIATRSKLLPQANANHEPFSDVNLGLALEGTDAAHAEDSKTTEWQQWGEESSVDLCLAFLQYNGVQIGMNHAPHNRNCLSIELQ